MRLLIGFFFFYYYFFFFFFFLFLFIFLFLISLFPFPSRLEESIDIVREQGDLESSNELGNIIADGIGNIISDDNLDDVDNLLGDVEVFIFLLIFLIFFFLILFFSFGFSSSLLHSPHTSLLQTLLLCFLECGADPVLIESENVSIGASTDTLENLGSRPLDLGDGAFVQLPDNLQVG